MKHILRNTTILLLGVMTMALTSCEKLEIPVITDCKVVETSPTVIETSAIMTSKQIDEYGIAWRKNSSHVTVTANDGTTTGTLDSEGHFTATVTLDTNADYYFIFFATNEIGTTTSETVKVHTSFFEPKKDDNPFPGL